MGMLGRAATRIVVFTDIGQTTIPKNNMQYLHILLHTKVNFFASQIWQQIRGTRSWLQIDWYF